MSRNNNSYVGEGSNVRQAMEGFKAEVATELGLTERIQSVGYENMTTRECGSIGGTMTKRMVQIAEQAISGNQTGV
jgi:small acid-soluble spore protein D (minor alpha/beta-type SASP)